MMHAHFDCFSGISGDMILGAFIDLGIHEQWLLEQISLLSIGDVGLSVRDVKENGIGAKQIRVIDHSRPKERHLSDIKAILETCLLRNTLVDKVIGIFQRIAEAEAKVHRCDIESVHFHEVGAVDSIVDIVGAVVCLDKLQVKSVTSSPLPLGSGFVDCQHGRLPVPAPATLEIVRDVPVYGGDLKGERVTPTGAAIIASIAQEFGPIPDMKVAKIGYGSGSRQTNHVPNLLRVLIGEKIKTSVELGNDEVYVIETNIDDMNPELFGYLMERLFDEGALDVCYTSIMMKKNRPATKIEVISTLKDKSRLENLLFTETSTIGLRFQKVHRHLLKRKMATVETVYGAVEVKCITGQGGKTQRTPEYDSCKRVALEKKVPLKTVYDEVSKIISNTKMHSVG